MEDVLEKLQQQISLLQEQINDIKKRLNFIEGQPISDKNVNRGLSIREFLIQKNPENDIMKCFYILGYLETFKGYETINAKDIEGGLREARQIIPSQLHNKLFRLVERGYIMEAAVKKDNLKAYILTNTGLNFLEK